MGYSYKSRINGTRYIILTSDVNRNQYLNHYPPVPLPSRISILGKKKQDRKSPQSVKYSDIILIQHVLLTDVR